MSINWEYISYTISKISSSGLIGNYLIESFPCIFCFLAHLLIIFPSKGTNSLIYPYYFKSFEFTNPNILLQEISTSMSFSVSLYFINGILIFSPNKAKIMKNYAKKWFFTCKFMDFLRFISFINFGL